VSDAIRGTKDTPTDHFNSLLDAFYIPIAYLVISAVFFTLAAIFVENDRRIAKQIAIG
jgi:hypothetical protein